MDTEGVYLSLRLSDDGTQVILEIGAENEELCIEIGMTAEDCFSLMCGLKEGITRLFETAAESTPKFTLIKGGKSDDTVH